MTDLLPIFESNTLGVARGHEYYDAHNLSEVSENRAAKARLEKQLCSKC